MSDRRMAPGRDSVSSNCQHTEFSLFLSSNGGEKLDASLSLFPL